LWKYIAQRSQGTSKDIIIITEAAQHLYGADVPACIIISEREGGGKSYFVRIKTPHTGSKTNFCDFSKLHYTLQEKLSSLPPKQMRTPKLIQTLEQGTLKLLSPRPKTSAYVRLSTSYLLLL